MKRPGGFDESASRAEDSDRYSRAVGGDETSTEHRTAKQSKPKKAKAPKASKAPRSSPTTTPDSLSSAASRLWGVRQRSNKDLAATAFTELGEGDVSEDSGAPGATPQASGIGDLEVASGAGGPLSPQLPGAHFEVSEDVDDAAASSGVRQARAELKNAERSRRQRERKEQRRFRAHSRNRKRRWLIGISTVLGLALFVAIGVFTPIMAVREVQVHGAQSVNADDLGAALARFEGVPLALVDDGEVHRALEPFPLIQRYAVERIPPHTLIVRIEERQPVIAMERDGGFDLFDPAGVLLSRVPERPVGVPVGSAELTDVSSPAFQAASTIVRDMPEDLRARLVSVAASNAQNVSFVLDSGTELIWGDATQNQRKAAVLRSMIAAVGTPSMIDVSAPDAPVFS